MRARRGWTLHEMLISLVVMAIVVALAAQTSLGQLRFFRGVGEVVTLRTQIGHAGAVAASMLRTVGSGLDILVALDSAIEFRATYGAAFACANENGRVTIAAQNSGRGNTLAGFDDPARRRRDLCLAVGLRVVWVDRAACHRRAAGRVQLRSLWSVGRLDGHAAGAVRGADGNAASVHQALATEFVSRLR
jgi:prepilin-type N-terminal cleavage/methylation domain-containing protein